MIKGFFIFLVLIIFPVCLFGQTPEKEMEGFSVSGFGKEGQRWQVSGEHADFIDENIVLDQVRGNIESETDQISLSAQEGIYNTQNSSIRLNHDVNVSSEQGLRLKTESLDWFGDKQIASTQDDVRIDKEGVVTKAKGLCAKPSLKTVVLRREVKLDVPAQQQDAASTSIVCDGPLVIDYKNNIAIFNKNVGAENDVNRIEADRMKVYFDPKQESINSMEAIGNVRIYSNENQAFAQKAVYLSKEKTVTLYGRPKLILFSDSMDLGELK